LPVEDTSIPYASMQRAFEATNRNLNVIRAFRSTRSTTPYMFRSLFQTALQVFISHRLLDFVEAPQCDQAKALAFLQRLFNASVDSERCDIDQIERTLSVFTQSSRQRSGNSSASRSKRGGNGRRSSGKGARHNHHMSIDRVTEDPRFQIEQLVYESVLEATNNDLSLSSLITYGMEEVFG